MLVSPAGCEADEEADEDEEEEDEEEGEEGREADDEEDVVVGTKGTEKLMGSATARTASPNA